MPIPQARCLRIDNLVVDLEQVAYINSTTEADGTEDMIIRFKHGDRAKLIKMTIKERAHLLDAFESYLQGRL